MRINALVSVIVDQVDIEQEFIACDKVESTIITIIRAARKHPDFKIMARLCYRIEHEIEYQCCAVMGMGKYLVSFVVFKAGSKWV